MLRNTIGKLHNFRLLPVFVSTSMIIGIGIGKFFGISNFQLTPPIDAIKSIFRGTYEFSIANTLAMGVVAGLFTLIVMFSLKGDLILENPFFIVQLAVPMTLFFWVMFVVVYLVSWKVGLNYRDSVAVGFNSTGRDFEIAIAIAITAFNPTVALATVIGPLIEVPVMLVLVWFARSTEFRLFRTGGGQGPASEASP